MSFAIRKKTTLSCEEIHYDEIPAEPLYMAVSIIPDCTLKTVNEAFEASKKFAVSFESMLE